jgi:hypothetical protein
MIITLALIILALFALLFLITIAKGRILHSSAAGSGPEVQPVDIQAFRNLIDSDEEEFLRRSLPPAEFRAVQRQRLLAAVAYIRCAAHNAGVLVRVGESARRSSDPSVVQAGERLVDTAIRLRLYAFQALVKLYVAILLPGARVSANGLAENYERMTHVVFLLGRLQHPSRQGSAAS